MANRREVLALAALAAQAPWLAHADEAPPPLQVEALGTGLYLIRGGGGNSLLRLSANGLVLVNGKSAGSYRPLMSQIRKINKLSDMPLRALILTDADAPQAANCAQFAAARVVVLAQANAAQRLADSGPGLVTFERGYSLHVGGVAVELRHFGPARTEADTVVHFPDKQVLAVGDLYLPDDAPLQPGASLAGWREALAQMLAMKAELFVPNQGPPVGRAELQAFGQRLAQPNLSA
ncbi:hypothetical protein [Pelomonas sp. KK5]|uniref:hypothetical protein n=1 Tax=Pelomonas sp. KK5 TaxID=1855730 RepID=UPI00097CB6C6|nr:hypothetical protein [Pelomonas sp. KK5]